MGLRSGAATSSAADSEKNLVALQTGCDGLNYFYYIVCWLINKWNAANLIFFSVQHKRYEVSKGEVNCQIDDI